ncbi:MAG: HAMP domain-containing histidine kinase [Deltaproteobacteria bacterium]|nr:HAMP domain-containing histidine kinase [Deltaproteobacteria bacterium]
MPAIINKFLLIGPWNPKLQEMGSILAKDLYEANYHFTRSNYDVIGINLTSLLEKKFVDYYTEWKSINPYLKLVAVIPKDFSKNIFINLHNKFSFFKIFYSYNDPEIENDLNLTLEKVYFDKQIESYKSLLDEQNKSLEKLKSDLEEKIEKRTKYLIESRKKLFLTNYRIEAFRKTITAIFKSNNINELEVKLNQELLQTFEIQWVKIYEEPDDKYFSEELKSKMDYDFLKLPIFWQNVEVGSVFFMRAKIKPFKKEETEFLSRITEAVSLSLERIEKNYKMEIIKNHWEATFKAIKEPVVLINNNFEVIQSNLPSDLNKNKCYKLIFNLDHPCKDCEKGSNFKLDNNNDHFEVLSQNILIEKQEYFINSYNNINEKLKLESKILLMAPDAELGIISSSLAHEMNNPLAGLLSFTQLILMDLTSEDPIYHDLKEIEQAAKRCRDIVDNLLVFSRINDTELVKRINLYDMIEKAFQLFHLQRQNKNFTLSYHLQKDLQVLGSSILMIQFFLELFLSVKNFIDDKISISGKSDQNFATLKILLTTKQTPTEALNIIEKYHLQGSLTKAHELKILFSLKSVNFTTI